MTLNNKGFAISAILYALLISFLLFLLVALNMFSASTNILNASNDDIVNGKSLYANQVIPTVSGSTCSNWFDYGSDNKVKVYSRYGVKYFPRDFSTGSTANGKLRAYISNEQVTFNLSSENNAAKPLTLNADYSPSSPYSYSLWSGTDLSGKTNSGSSVYFLALYDTATSETYYLGLFDICG
ncbi:MAG: hypothetical protein MR296_04050 [Tenericutes bacterium]|nr:hypothetical protein [Mycoplasmatota bacterium]